METIETIHDLDRFVENAGIDSPDLIIPKLAEEKQIISVEMAKLISQLKAA